MEESTGGARKSWAGSDRRDGVDQVLESDGAEVEEKGGEVEAKKDGQTKIYAWRYEPSWFQTCNRSSAGVAWKINTKSTKVEFVERCQRYEYDLEVEREPFVL